MRSIAFTDFLVGLGILFVLEGLMFAASPAWMRRAMKSALATPDNILRIGRHRLGGRGPAPDLVRAAVGFHRHFSEGPKGGPLMHRLPIGNPEILCRAMARLSSLSVPGLTAPMACK